LTQEGDRGTIPLSHLLFGGRKMIETITAIVRQYLTDEGLAVTEESNLKEDLGLDSFDIMNILIECEDAFGVRISDEVLGNFVTVKDIKKKLLEKG
jgi:acyl carrier protein